MVPSLAAKATSVELPWLDPRAKTPGHRAGAVGTRHFTAKGLLRQASSSTRRRSRAPPTALKTLGQGYGLVLDVGVAIELGVHRNEIVHPVDLHSVAGIVDQGDRRAVRLLLEVAQGVPHRQRIEVVEMGDVEADRRQLIAMAEASRGGLASAGTAL